MKVHSLTNKDACTKIQGYLKQKDGPFPGFSVTLMWGPTHHHHHHQELLYALS